MTGPASAVADNGNSVTYGRTITNNGPSDAQTVSVADTLPPGLTFVSITAPAGWNCITPAVGAAGTIICTTATLIKAGAASLTLVAHVGLATAVGPTISDTATVTAATTDPAAGNNTSTISATVATDIPMFSSLMLMLLALGLGAMAIRSWK